MLGRQVRVSRRKGFLCLCPHCSSFLGQSAIDSGTCSQLVLLALSFYSSWSPLLSLGDWLYAAARTSAGLTLPSKLRLSGLLFRCSKCSLNLCSSFPTKQSLFENWDLKPNQLHHSVERLGSSLFPNFHFLANEGQIRGLYVFANRNVCNGPRLRLQQ